MAGASKRHLGAAEVREYLLDNIDKIGEGPWWTTQFYKGVVVYDYSKYGVES